MSSDPGDRGPSQRQLRVGETVRRALSDILMRGEHHEPGLEGLAITVSEVRLTPDLRHATAYVMPLGGREADRALAGLGRARGELRRLVGRQLTMKYTPELRFELDPTFDRMDETRRMLDQDAVRRDLSAGTGDDEDD